MEEDVPKGKTKFTFEGATFIIDSRYEPIKITNHSSRGPTISAMDRKENRKVLIQKIQLEDPEEWRNIFREIMLLSFSNNRNVINLLDIQYIYPDNDLYLVTEFMDMNLYKILKSRAVLPQEHAKFIIYGILRGLFYMHSVNVIHRDLRPANILINRNLALKICGLGLSKNWKVNEEISARWYINLQK